MADERKPLHVVSLSGGKDSTAMLLRMLEEGMPVDVILFCDTGLEFPALYRHLDRLERNIGHRITRIRPDKPFEYYFLEHESKRKSGEIRKGYSWAGPRMRWCTTRLKTQPREKFLTPLRKKYRVIEYVGIAADEGYRLGRKINSRDECLHPLVDWGMTEAECLQYCYDRGYDWEGLYNLFHRVSCWCCPLQSLEDLRKLFWNFPELWKKLEYWDSLTWRNFRADYSVKDLERRFVFEVEWQKAGSRLGTRAFFVSLKEYLEEQNREGRQL